MKWYLSRLCLAVSDCCILSCLCGFVSVFIVVFVCDDFVTAGLLRRPPAARPVLGYEIDPVLGLRKGLVLLQTVCAGNGLLVDTEHDLISAWSFVASITH